MTNSNPQEKKTIKNINEKELEVLNFWNENKIFEKSLETPAGQNPNGNFTFYDGPPFATGLPHHGHLLAGTIKDAIPRYQAMNGKYVRRVWGWDCHGLPLENIVEKELNLKHKKDIEDYGIKNFVEKAKSMMLTYEADWKAVVPRMGRWIDMDHPYKTMDTNYTESVWWSFKTLYDKGLIYEGYKAMHICPRCETTLAQSEVNMPGAYKDLTDISVTAKFELEERNENGSAVYVLAWTTTPWTLPGNTGLAINKNETYVKVRSEVGGDISYFILAKSRLENYFNENSNVIIVKEFSGEELIGKKYKPVFDLDMANLEIKNKENLFKIWHADFITMDTGTGIAHQAPAFGAEDLDLAKQNDMPVIHHVLLDGSFIKEVNQELFNKKIIDEAKQIEKIIVKSKEDNQATDILIIKYLAAIDRLFAKEKIIHSYPTCWRCETPLLNYATSSWFMDVPAIKDKNISENQKIHWVPDHIQNGRFGKWLEGSREWALSRQRYWGAPLPVWKCQDLDCKNIKVVGSIADLGESVPRNDAGEIDLHRPYIDDVKLDCKCGSKMKRIIDVFDCWYESGSMPYASIHYPFENKELFDANFPADFIAEGLDQTRGWFYTLLNLSVGLFDKASFKNVIVNGLVMAGDGEKMSKSKKNFTDPLVLVEKYGADAFRYSLLSSPVMNGENIPFPDSFVEDSYKKVVAKLENVLSFYEALDKSGLTKKQESITNPLNIWILLRLNEVIENTTKAMNEYRLDLATRPFEKFVDDLSTWYLRRSREKLKDGDMETLAVMGFVLSQFAKVIAPFMPFLSERVYLSINEQSPYKKESVHLESWPEIYKNEFDKNVLAEMEEVRNLVTELLMIRQKNNLPVRQPLASATVASKIDEKYFDIICDEVNVKEILLGSENSLDLNLTPELKREGDQRELSRAIKDKRKEFGLVPSDEIVLTVTEDKRSLLNEAYLKEMKVREVKAGDELNIEKFI